MLLVILAFASFSSFLLCLRSFVLFKVVVFLTLIFDLFFLSRPLFDTFDLHILFLGLILLSPAEEVADEQRPVVLLSLLLGSLDDLSPLLFLLLLSIDILPVLLALEVLRLILQARVIRQVTFTTGDDHEIFPVFDNDDDKDY